MDTRQTVFELITTTFADTPEAKAGKAVIRSGKDLDKLLRSHLVKEPSDTEIAERDQIEALLDYYAVLEIAHMVGCVPEKLPPEHLDTAEIELGNQAVRRYYDFFYPMPLPSAYYDRVQGLPRTRYGEFEGSFAEFQNFLALVSITKRDDIDLFLWALDDGIKDGYDLSDVLRVVLNPERFARNIMARRSRGSTLETMVQGFVAFLEFCAELDEFLTRLGHVPLLQSAFWQYFGYWFRQLDGQILGVVGVGLNTFEEWARDKKAASRVLGKGADITDRINASVEGLRKTHLAVQRLTSSIYRAPYEVHVLRHQTTAPEQRGERESILQPERARAEFFTAVVKGAEGPAKQLFDPLIKEAKEDTKAFLELSKEDLKLWTKQLAENELTKAEFQNLVKGQEALAKLHALAKAGIAAAELERFRTKLIDLVINTAFRMFLKV